MSTQPLRPVTTTQISSPQQFHPKFNDPGAEIILASSEGTLFCIHSAILQSASGLLRFFLSGPNSTKREANLPSNEDEKCTSQDNDDSTAIDVITLPFSEAPLEQVLLMISAQPIPQLKSFDELEAAIDVMEYLDTPGPLSFVRYLCLTPILLSEPIRVYGLGARYGWEDVMQHAAKQTLKLNLFPPPSAATPEAPKSVSKSIEDQIFRMPGNALYRLIRLHRRRRDEFRAFIQSPINFPGGHAATWACVSCGRTNDNSPWQVLSARLVWEMDQDASGEGLMAGLDSWEESHRFWKSECHCGRVKRDRVDIHRKLRDCIQNLPTDI